MVQFGIPDYPVLGPHVLLVADVSVMAIPYVVASVAKTLSKS
jgi:hypothetical protein